MITVKSPREVELMARAGSIVADVLALVRSKTAPGVSTWELDRIAEEFIRSHDGATPSFKGLYGFPATLCTSINAEVVHGRFGLASSGFWRSSALCSSTSFPTASLPAVAAQ